MAGDKPEGWRYRVFAGYVLDHLSDLDQPARVLPSQQSGDPTEPLPIEALGEWCTKRLGDLAQLVHELTAFVNSAEGLQRLKSVETEADAIAIANRILFFAGAAQGWVNSVTRSNLPPICHGLRDELARFGDEVVGGITQFVAELKQFLDAGDFTGPASIVLRLGAPDPARLDRELRKITQFLVQIPQSDTACVPNYDRAGYIYMLINPAMDGLVKIGRTERDPKTRARELGSVTGVPTPFILVFDIRVADAVEAEKLVHIELDHLATRVAANREFFRVEPSRAISIMLDVQRRVGERRK